MLINFDCLLLCVSVTRANAIRFLFVMSNNHSIFMFFERDEQIYIQYLNKSPLALARCAIENANKTESHTHSECIQIGRPRARVPQFDTHIQHITTASIAAGWNGQKFLGE